MRINYRFRRSPPAATGRSLVRVGALGLCNVGAVIVVDTYYDTLGVSPAADERDIRIAFHRLAKRLHPDLNAGDADAVRCFKEISCAYKVLRDAGTRAAYDAHLEQLRAVVARDRAPAAAAGLAVRQQFWRVARIVAPSCVVVGIGVAAFSMSRPPEMLVASTAIMELAPRSAPAALQPTPPPNVRQAQADVERSVPGDAGQVRPFANPEPAVVPPPPLSGEALAQATRLVTQGERYLAQGNIAIAREYFERAADLGLAAAAMKMAETYDPAALAVRGALGPKPNAAEARKWYERAMALGMHDAEAQLHRLDDR